MLRVLLCVLWAGLAPAVLGQCCTGAQPVEGRTPDGRHRVRAESVPGHGFEWHGPYRYRFTWLAADEEVSTFVVDFDTTAHFSMRIFVSPTGNGFLLDTSLAPAAAFYSPTGQVLATLDRGHQVGWYEPETPDGYHVQLWGSTARPSGEGAFDYDRAGVLFLPFGTRIDAAFRDRLAGLLRNPPVELPESDIDDALTALDADHYDDRVAAADALRALGPLALAALERAAADPSRPEVQNQARRLLVDLTPWRVAGGLAALSDPRFLVGLASSPDAGLAGAALGRLRRIVPDGPAGPADDATAWTAWLSDHEGDLVRDGDGWRLDRD